MNNTISIQLLKTCFESQYYPEYFKGHHTHDSGLKFVGEVLQHTQDRDFIRRIIVSGLPPGYDGDALREVDRLIEWNLKNPPTNKAQKGDKSPTESAKLMQAAMTSNIELFHTTSGRTYISILQEGKGRKNYALTSQAASLWLRKISYEKSGKPVPSHTLKEVVETLQAKALYESPQKQVFLRIAKHDDSIIVNLADDGSNVVIINAEGYRVSTDSPALFVYPSSSEPLPLPQPGGDLRDIQRLLGLDDINFYRVVAFIINCLKPDGPYILLLVEGEQGSGKSFLCTLLKLLIDPCQVPKLRLPDSTRDLMIQAKENHLLVFDNISGMKGDLSDALCSLSTGGGFSTRKLYSDDEQQIFNECRPYILNGITSIANRPDLLERSISLKLKAMPEGARKTEEMMLRQFMELRPFILAKLCEIVACGLRNFDSVEAPTSIRMADAAKWLVAAEPATGLPKGALLQALENSQHEVAVERMASNSLAIALGTAVERGPFDGTVGTLYQYLENFRAGKDRDFPATAAHMSRALERMRPALKQAGIMVEPGPRTRKGKTIRVWFAEQGTFEEAQQLNALNEGKKEF